MDHVKPQTLARWLETDEPVEIVDIRSPRAFEQEHIPGSRNIPFQRLPQRLEELAESPPIVTVCPHGELSQRAARLIESYEATGEKPVYNLTGGLARWDGPLVKP